MNENDYLTGLILRYLSLPWNNDFGEQNTLEESHQIMDFALDHGINFFDTAEMYPIPPCEETHFKTEEYIGKLPANEREDIILATKMIGPSSLMTYIRGGPRSIKDNAKEAITGLKKTKH